MYNKIILVGNLTRNIEIRYTQGGLSIASTAIATSKKFKSQTGENKEEGWSINNFRLKYNTVNLKSKESYL